MTRSRDIADQQKNLGGAVPPFVAGKNFLINGGMDVWQRGTTITSGAFDAKYIADRWQSFTATGSNTFTQETTTVPTGARYALKYTSGAASSGFGVYQAIETANTLPLVGKTVTIQAQVTGTTGRTATMQLFSSTTVDQTPISVTTLVDSGNTVTFTSGTFSTLTLTAIIPAGVKTLKVGILSAGSFNSGEYVTFGNVQLEVGSVATSFTRAGSTIAGELALCQRYYYRSTAAVTNTHFCAGFGLSSTSIRLLLQNPVQMRASATSIDYSNLQVGDGNTTVNVTNLVIGFTGFLVQTLTATVASGGTQFRPFNLFDSNGTGYVGISAEL